MSERKLGHLPIVLCSPTGLGTLVSLDHVVQENLYKTCPFHNDTCAHVPVHGFLSSLDPCLHGFSLAL